MDKKAILQKIKQDFDNAKNAKLKVDSKIAECV
jgi:hypothetical protein